MNKIILSFIIVIIIILVFGAGIYFNKQDIENFEKTDIGNFIKEATKEVFNPAPLRIVNPFKDVVLTSSQVLLETNIQRNIYKLPIFYRNDILDKTALAKAKDMFKNQYFEHNSPAGVTPADLVKSFGYNYIVTGENLILGNFASEKDLVQAWMASPGHMANILNNRYTEIGIAVLKGEYNGQITWIGVQEFALPLSACNQPDSELKNQIDQQKLKLDELSLQIDQKKEVIDNSASNYKKYNELVEEYNSLIKQYENLAGIIKSLIAKYNNQVSVFNQCVAGNN